MTQTTVMITGASGKVGRVLWRGLQDDYDLRGLDREQPAGEARIQVADIAEMEQIRAAFAAAGPFTHLVHLAADPRVEAPWESVLRNNIIGTRNIYEAAREHGVHRIVFASSNHVTGAYEGVGGHLALHRHHEPPQITIHDPVRPDSDYGVSKAFGESLARYYAARWGLSSICLRIGVVLGDDDPGEHERLRKIWLSHRDLNQITRLSLETDIVFGTYYALSANQGRFYSIENARQELGYAPQDGMPLLRES